MGGLEEVSGYLRASGAEHEIRVLEDSTKTSALAAQALGCTVAEIAKSVVFVGLATTVVVLPGNRRVDVGKLRPLVGGDVRAGTSEEVVSRTGYAVGGVPPFPHGTGVRVIVERGIMDHKEVWAAAGAPNAVFRIRSGDLARLVGEVKDLSS